MKRYPDGVDGEYFYEKNAPKHRPDWVKTAAIGAVTIDGISTTCWSMICRHLRGWQTLHRLKFIHPSRWRKKFHVRP